MTPEGEARPRRVEVSTPTIAEFLASTALFTGCDRVTIVKIAPHVFPVEVPAGVVVVRAGVRSGDDTIEEVAAGGAFGETGAFLGTTQPYEVAAAEDSVMLLLSHEVVNQLATKIAPFAFAAARRMAQRSLTTTQTIPVRRAASTAPLPVIDRGDRSARGTDPPIGDDIRFVKISSYDPSPQIVSAVPAKLIQQHRLFPLAMRDRTLTVGMVDPTNTASRMELQRVMSTSSVVVVAISQDDFNEAYVRLRID